MKTPRSLNEQRMAHGRGEVYRGCGIWPIVGLGSPLEPPFEAFARSGITEWDLAVNRFDAPYQGRFFDKLKRLFFPVHARPLELRGAVRQHQGPLHIVRFRHYREDEVTPANVEQLLLAFGAAQEPIALEMFGIGKSRQPGGGGPPRIEIRFASSRNDLPLLKAQLHSLYPRSAVESHQQGFHESDHQFKSSVLGRPDGTDPLFVTPLCLAAPYCFPIRTSWTASADPVGALVALMDRLENNQWALLQIIFQRARHPWANNLRLACQDPYKPRQFLVSGLDQKSLLAKLHGPLYAASITLAANRQRVLSSMASFILQYQGPHNRLAVRNQSGPWPVENVTPDLWRDAILSRQVLSPGMLLNIEELAGIAHIPSAQVLSERLLRVTTQTSRPPATALNSRLAVIGQNSHRGHLSEVAIPADIRARHCYVAGATGTGKSTLLANMIIQDISAGHGIGLLDPHGDLVKFILRHIPRNRIDDVVLFDASDIEFPFALNILEARDETECERIVAETILALERNFPASWGPRLEQILQYTIRTALHAIPGATLADVEQLLTDDNFREVTLRNTSDSRLLSFWTNEFAHFPRHARDPVLNKLGPFLQARPVRNIICQRRAAVNFDQLLNQRKILLANLSAGLLTEKVAGTLGSFLVTKIVNAAFRRVALAAGQRRPWHLYIDEFQNFLNLAVGFERILAEARKQGLTLTAANQHVGQLTQAVRQAIFGNVGSLIVFRLGVEDAHTVAKELGIFTAQDLLNLELGQAIARVGGSSAAFNLVTYKEPTAPFDNPTRRIIASARQRYAKPRSEVERELAEVTKVNHRISAAAAVADEPSDPNEDDLVA
jgi:hypothetical protein